MEKIVLGLSGGVDSAVSAVLLKKEYEVHGLYLDIGLPGGAEEAMAAAKALDVPLTVLDIRCALEEKVFALRLKDGTRPKKDVWAELNADTLRGEFLRRMRQKTEAAQSDTERETLYAALRFGLAALDGRDL